MISETAITAFKAIPTADVAEVKHGKWKKESDVIGRPYMACSVCKKHVFAISEYDYCPNCGAKMDKEKGGAE